MRMTNFNANSKYTDKVNSRASACQLGAVEFLQHRQTESVHQQMGNTNTK